VAAGGGIAVVRELVVGHGVSPKGAHGVQAAGAGRSGTMVVVRMGEAARA
jgi:hypothetical protein